MHFPGANELIESNLNLAPGAHPTHYISTNSKFYENFDHYNL